MSYDAKIPEIKKICFKCNGRSSYKCHVSNLLLYLKKNQCLHMFTQISLKTQLQERALLDAVCYNYSWSALAHNVLSFLG